jgi:putative DNA primase/helicase
MPNLSTIEGQAMLDRYLEGIEVVLLDNVSTLFQGGPENEAESWILAQDFLLRLRQRGLFALYVHHAGRNGLPRGHSKREDVLDTIIELRHPDDYSPTEGVRFEVHYKKARGAFGQNVSAFETNLTTDPETHLPKWVIRSVEDALYERVIELTLDGVSQADIARDIRRDKSRVCRMVKRAKTEGRIP